jgi:hypothetical protein
MNLEKDKRLTVQPDSERLAQPTSSGHTDGSSWLDGAKCLDYRVPLAQTPRTDNPQKFINLIAHLAQ